MAVKLVSRAWRLSVFLLVTVCVAASAHAADAAAAAAAAGGTGSSQGTQQHNVWAVVVGSSRYWSNYRHTSNALSMYHLLRRNGIDDDHIILMLGENYACDPRNAYPAEVIDKPYTNRGHSNLYGCSAQVDYSGDDVDARHFLNVLQGRYSDSTPDTRRMLSDSRSHIVIYVAGHSARSWYKFLDFEFVGSRDLSETFMMMHKQRRYGKITFVVDSCHALSLCEFIKAPNIICMTSSSASLDSYSYGDDPALGVTISSLYMNEMTEVLRDTSCEDPTAGAHVTVGADGKSTVSALHLSWHDFHEGPLRKEVAVAGSLPAMQTAANDPRALQEWLVSDFMCPPPTNSESVKIQYDLF